MKPCPNCKSRATKIVHLSAADKPVECQICGHRYNEHERISVCPFCAAGDGPHTLEHEGKP